MKQMQKGFTLIELMIVVAIIGTLSAIAVPAYKNYVKKSEASAGLSTVRALLTNIDMYQQEEGAFPDGSTGLEAIGATTGMNPLGRLAVAKAVSAAGGTATFTFGNPGTSKLTGTIEYTKSGTGWVCANTTGETLKSCS